MADMDVRHDRSITAIKPPEDVFSPGGYNPGYDIFNVGWVSLHGRVVREENLRKTGCTFPCTVLYDGKKGSDLPSLFVMAKNAIPLHDMACRP